MKVEVSMTRVYEMDEARCLADRGFEPPPPGTPVAEVRAWLRETFYELCGWERDQDHIDGSYVRLVEESGDAEFDWPVPAPQSGETQ